MANLVLNRLILHIRAAEVSDSLLLVNELDDYLGEDVKDVVRSVDSDTGIHDVPGRNGLDTIEELSPASSLEPEDHPPKLPVLDDRRLGRHLSIDMTMELFKYSGEAETARGEGTGEEHRGKRRIRFTV